MNDNQQTAEWKQKTNVYAKNALKTNSELIENTCKLRKIMERKKRVNWIAVSAVYEIRQKAITKLQQQNVIFWPIQNL